ncbi:hypothetical protein Mgra_00007549 [Meloidogyne graminicola]|uniref:Uncharacterized protein n=1 Tax=Meloidogyne graminicola TaxID=189291 RepID=A0A8S9ZI97_9BILA|nr:hypothetical protein Mgra_00007549 [Meloidogyne graminicola]
MDFVHPLFFLIRNVFTTNCNHSKMRTKNKFKILLLFVFYCIGSSTIEENEKEEEINTPKINDSNVEENRLKNKFNVPKQQPNMFMRTLSIFDDENLDNKATIKIEEKQVEKQNIKPSHSNSQKKKDRKQIKIINIPTAIKAFETFLENNMEIYYEINDKKDILFKEAIEILPNWDMNNIIKEIKNLYNKIENEKNNNENLKEKLIEKLNLFILSPQTLENVNKITLKLVQNYISKNDRKTVQNPNFNENEIEIQLLSGELQQYRKNTNVILSKIVEYLKNYPTDYFNLYSSFLTVSNDYSEIITNYKNKYNKLKEQFNNILKGIDVTGMETFPKLRTELLKKLNKLKDIKFVESIKKTKEEFISDLILKEIKIEETLKGKYKLF